MTKKTVFKEGDIVTFRTKDQLLAFNGATDYRCKGLNIIKNHIVRGTVTHVAETGSHKKKDIYPDYQCRNVTVEFKLDGQQYTYIMDEDEFVEWDEIVSNPLTPREAFLTLDSNDNFFDTEML